jgi:hypothetical protein
VAASSACGHGDINNVANINHVSTNNDGNNRVNNSDSNNDSVRDSPAPADVQGTPWPQPP